MRKIVLLVTIPTLVFALSGCSVFMAMSGKKAQILQRSRSANQEPLSS